MFWTGWVGWFANKLNPWLVKFIDCCWVGCCGCCGANVNCPNGKELACVCVLPKFKLGVLFWIGTWLTGGGAWTTGLGTDYYSKKSNPPAPEVGC